MIRSAAIALLALGISAASGQTAVRNYYAPVTEGLRVDACLSASGNCGKPAADAFCKAEGYKESILFQREAAKQSTRYLGSGATCENGSCTAFRQIKCFTPGEALASVQN